MWTLSEAVELCRKIEAVVPQHGCHVALTGGVLYKVGERKDLDLMFYRVRQVEKINEDGLFASLGEIGVKYISGFGWCRKAEYDGKKIDLLFPEQDGDHNSGDASNPAPITGEI